MEVVLVNHSEWIPPQEFVKSWLASLSVELGRSGHPVKGQEITVAFVEKLEIQKINCEFRGLDKPTDILSFEDESKEVLGELALCGEIIDAQAMEHGLSSRQELGYLLIHGILHLLGYEHERGGEPEKKMFALQDQLFDILSERFFRD